MKDLYVVNCCRTAIGSFGGSLKNTPAAEMGAIVVKEALKRANVAPENVDELMFGCILTAAQGQNVARQASIKAGIPYSVPAYTVGMVCGSGMKSVIEGARSILAGDSDIVVCGGTENMSAAPFASLDARWGARMGDKKLVDMMVYDGVFDVFNQYHMGITAENVAEKYGITRQMQDKKHASSQQKQRQNGTSQYSKNECSHLCGLLYALAGTLCFVGIPSYGRKIQIINVHGLFGFKARRTTSRKHFLQRRNFRLTARTGQWATIGKHAAFRAIHGTWHGALRIEVNNLTVGTRRAGCQQSCIRMHRTAENFFNTARFYNAAEIHHHHTIADVTHDV